MTNLHAKSAVEFPVVSLCKLFGVTKQAYYKRDDDKSMKAAALESLVEDFIREIREVDPEISGVKLWSMYMKGLGLEHPIGRDKFCAIFAEKGFRVREVKLKPRTTDSTHGLPVYPNLVKDLIPTRPNQLWVSDITYIEMEAFGIRLFCYLSLILDAYSKEIVGWSVGETLSTEFPLEALRMALKRLKGGAQGLIHHSDRGVQYASRVYVSELSSHGIRISMTESGNPKDNAQAERINGTIKNEFLTGKTFSCVAEVREAVARAVDFYNNERPHMSINMMTPVEAGMCSGPLKKKWISYRERAIMRNMGQEKGTTKIGLPLPSELPPYCGNSDGNLIQEQSQPNLVTT